MFKLHEIWSSYCISCFGNLPCYYDGRAHRNINSPDRNIREKISNNYFKTFQNNKMNNMYELNNIINNYELLKKIQ